METRICNVQSGKPGGNASKGARNYRISIPSMWAQQMGIAPEDKTVSISFDGQRIIIEKIESKQ